MPLDHAVTVPPLPLAERLRVGRNLRKAVPRREHAHWVAPAGRSDPVQTLLETTRHHLPRLLSIRFDRMRSSPFAFFQGAVAVMAMDLAQTPTSGLQVQACGDCHFMNFGVSMAPGENPLFEILDFEETLPAPFEWDLKRLATSFVVAGQSRGLPAHGRRHLARAAVQAYRMQMAELASLDPLTVKRSHLDIADHLLRIEDPKLRVREQSRLSALEEASRLHYPKLLERRKRRTRFRARSPVVMPLADGDNIYEAAARTAFDSYHVNLPEEQRLLLDHYHLVDVA